MTENSKPDAHPSSEASEHSYSTTPLISLELGNDLPAAPTEPSAAASPFKEGEAPKNWGAVEADTQEQVAPPTAVSVRHSVGELDAAIGEQSDDVGQGVTGGAPAGVVDSDGRLLPVVIDSSSDSSVSAVPVQLAHFPHSLPAQLELIRAQNGKAYSVRRDKRNPYVLTVGSRALNNVIREAGQYEGLTLRQSAITDVNHYLQAKVDMTGFHVEVSHRVAAVAGGVEIDLGTEDHTRVRITAGKVEIITEGSETLFWRTASCLPMVMPSEVGNLALLKKYVPLHSVGYVLLVAWITWTLAHPKIATSKYLILLLQGGQGTGKSALSKLILQLIDPSLTGVQTLHSNAKDFAIAAQNAHVVCYDNLRGISPALADLLCMAATGGTISSRQLYTDGDQNILCLLVALILNGIHAFVDQPDLAQRCLPLQLEVIPEGKRKSEVDLAIELEADLPAIQRGLFDLIAKIFEQLPNAKVTSPARMLDFSRWLAAMELVHGAPAGVYQGVYCDALNQGQLDALLDNLLAAAVLEFAEGQVDGMWSGTPAALLGQLNLRATPGMQRSRDWPQNVIALSKRLLPLQAGLLTQGVTLELSRGKHRTITIKKTEEAANA